MAEASFFSMIGQPGTGIPKVADESAAYDRKNMDVLGWEVMDLRAHTSGFKFKLNNGHRNLSEGALQPGVSYIIEVQRRTKSFYVYIMVS